ncbi:MAG: DUF2306 domain-containing protein [Tateyamaria sp.]|uniref:DUF2306 domain-containing protein n=1 Tax=Tateyamaria sp. TaxID=1929288 RepID=UPI00329C615E
MSVTILPLLEASPVIQFHVASASTALLLGPLALYRKRRDRLHKVTGYTWVLAMGIAALSSFWIHDFPVIGPFSPIHLLAVLALWSLYKGMHHVFAGRIREHEIVMRSLYMNGLLVAGMFNFLPGRVTNRVVFGEAPLLGYVVMALGLSAIVIIGLRRRRALKRLALGPRVAAVGRSSLPLAHR